MEYRHSNGKDCFMKLTSNSEFEADVFEAIIILFLNKNYVYNFISKV